MKLLIFSAFAMIATSSYATQIECKRFHTSDKPTFTIKNDVISAGIQITDSPTIVHYAEKFEHIKIEKYVQKRKVGSGYAIEISNSGAHVDYKDTINILINKVSGAEFNDRYLITLLTRQGYDGDSEARIYLCEHLKIVL